MERPERDSSSAKVSRRRDRHADVASLSEDTWPFEPFLDMGLNERSEDCHSRIDEETHRARLESEELGEKEVEHPEDRNDTSCSVPHAYSKVGNLLPGTYSGATLQPQPGPRVLRLPRRGLSIQNKSAKHTGSYNPDRGGTYRPYG